MFCSMLPGAALHEQDWLLPLWMCIPWLLMRLPASLTRRARVVLQAAELGARELCKQLAEAMVALGGAAKEES